MRQIINTTKSANNYSLATEDFESQKYMTT